MDAATLPGRAALRYELPRDLLGEAARWLRRATRIPYDAEEPEPWLHEFQRCASASRRLLAARAAELRHECPDSPPRIRPLARREIESHEQVACMMDDVFVEAYLVLKPDLLDMVRLTEAAKALEHAIQRQRERRSDLLFEATYRDIGGG